MTVNYSQTPINNEGFDMQEHDISANGRQIGFHYGRVNASEDLDSIFKMNVFMYEYHIDSDTKQITANSTDLDVENCYGYNFKGYTLSEDSLHHSFWVKKNETIKLKGDFAKDTFRILKTTISSWNNETRGNCSSEDIIDYYINKTPIFVLLGDSYINFDSGKAEIIENTKVVDEFLISGFTKSLDILVRK